MTKTEAKQEILARLNIKDQEGVVKAAKDRYDAAQTELTEAHMDLHAVLDKYLEMINFKEEENKPEEDEANDGSDEEESGGTGSDSGGDGI
jgi:hypothetical protein